MRSVIEIKNQKDLDLFLQSEKFFIIDFFADWCQPCVMFKEIVIKQVEEQQLLTDDVRMAKVNVDLLGDIASEYRVTALPTVILFENGKEKTRFLGFKPTEEFLKIIQENYGTHVVK